jgi:hypothetical protein
MDEQRRRLEREVIKNLDSPMNLRYLANHLERSGVEAKPRIFKVSSSIKRLELGSFNIPGYRVLMVLESFAMSMDSAKELLCRQLVRLVESQNLFVPDCLCVAIKKGVGFNEVLDKIHDEFKKSNDHIYEREYLLSMEIDNSIIYTGGELTDDMLIPDLE